MEKEKSKYRERYKLLNKKLRESEWQRIKIELLSNGYKEIKKNGKLTTYYINTSGEIRNKWGREIGKGQKTLDGYCHVTLSLKDEKWCPYIHQLVWLTFVGEIPKGYEIDHINTNRSDNRLENLRCVDKPTNRKNPKSVLHYKESNKNKGIVRQRRELLI